MGADDVLPGCAAALPPSLGGCCTCGTTSAVTHAFLACVLSTHVLHTWVQHCMHPYGSCHPTLWPAAGEEGRAGGDVVQAAAATGAPTSQEEKR